MKKFLILPLSLIYLSGCMTYLPPTIDKGGDFNFDQVPTNKVKMYCAKCNESDLEDYFILSDKLEDSDYYLKFNENHRFDYYESADSIGLIILQVFTAGFLTYPTGMIHYEVGADLYDTKTGRKTPLTPIELSGSMWMGWLAIPFGYFGSDGTDQNTAIKNSAIDESTETVIKEAAMIVYGFDGKEKTDTSWKCGTFDCNYNEIMKKTEITIKDLIYIAKEAPSLREFKKGYAKFKGKLDKNSTCNINYNLLTTGKVSKDKQLYWYLLDNYKKDKCSSVSSGNYKGLEEETLIKKAGHPDRITQINGDTKKFIYFTKQGYINDGSGFAAGVTVEYKIYTIDKGIVTGISYDLDKFPWK